MVRRGDASCWTALARMLAARVGTMNQPLLVPSQLSRIVNRTSLRARCSSPCTRWASCSATCAASRSANASAVRDARRNRSGSTRLAAVTRPVSTWFRSAGVRFSGNRLAVVAITWACSTDTSPAANAAPVAAKPVFPPAGPDPQPPDQSFSSSTPTTPPYSHAPPAPRPPTGPPPTPPVTGSPPPDAPAVPPTAPPPHTRQPTAPGRSTPEPPPAHRQQHGQPRARPSGPPETASHQLSNACAQATTEHRHSKPHQPRLWTTLDHPEGLWTTR